VLLAAAAVAPSTQADPVLYSVAFDGSGAGDPGTGSFLFDDATGVMTDFIWDFGAGRTGGFTDAALAESLGALFGDITFGEGLFEMFVGVFTVPTTSRSFSRGAGSLIGPFPTNSPANPVEFCWGDRNMTDCGMPDGTFPTYEFVNDDVFFRGMTSISPD
jgi:hypothetical protein